MSASEKVLEERTLLMERQGTLSAGDPDREPNLAPKRTEISSWHSNWTTTYCARLVQYGWTLLAG
jgi:hypothetical protein